MDPVMSGGFAIWCLLMFVVWIAVVTIPVWRIVKRAGFPGFWSLLVVVPLVNLIALWIFSFSRWPAEGRARR
jgi:hypothetical protein